jgi:predicted nuclease of predicted toxin-antitoxin system
MKKLGMTDEQQFEVAIQKQAIIFTHDTDFIRIAADRDHLGIIYVHQQKLLIGDCIRRLKMIVQTQTAEEMRNRIIFL